MADPATWEEFLRELGSADESGRRHVQSQLGLSDHQLRSAVQLLKTRRTNSSRSASSSSSSRDTTKNSGPEEDRLEKIPGGSLSYQPGHAGIGMKREREAVSESSPDENHLTRSPEAKRAHFSAPGSHLQDRFSGSAGAAQQEQGSVVSGYAFSLGQSGTAREAVQAQPADDEVSSANEGASSDDEVQGAGGSAAGGFLGAGAAGDADLPEEDGDDRNSWDGDDDLFAAERRAGVAEESFLSDGADEQLLRKFWPVAGKGDSTNNFSGQLQLGGFLDLDKELASKKNATLVRALQQGQAGANEKLRAIYLERMAAEDKNKCATLAQAGKNSNPNQALERHQRFAAMMAGDEANVRRTLVFHRTGAGKSKTMLKFLDEKWARPQAKIVLLKNRTQKENLIRECLKWPSKLRDFFASENEREANRLCVAGGGDWRQRKDDAWDLGNYLVEGTSSASAGSSSSTSTSSTVANLPAQAPQLPGASAAALKDLLAAFERTLELRGSILSGKIKPAAREAFAKNMRKALKGTSPAVGSGPQSGASASGSTSSSSAACATMKARQAAELDARLPAAPVRFFTFGEIGRSLRAAAASTGGARSGQGLTLDAALKFPQTEPNPLDEKYVIVDEAHNLCLCPEVLKQNPRSATAVRHVVAALRGVSGKTSVMFLTATPVVRNLSGEYDSKFLLNVLRGEASKAAGVRGEEGFVSYYDGKKGFPEVRTDLQEDFTLFGKTGCQAHVVETELSASALARYAQQCRKLQHAAGRKHADSEKLLRWCAADKQLTKHTRRDELVRAKQQNVLHDRFPKLMKVVKLVKRQLKEGKVAIFVSLRGGLENLVQLLHLELDGEHKVLVMRDQGADSTQALTEFNRFVWRSDSEWSYPVLVANNKYCSESVTMLEVLNAHFLDVPPSWLEFQQLVGRCCRFRSHEKLAVAKQFVRYFLHVATYPFGNGAGSEWERVVYSTVLMLKEGKSWRPGSSGEHGFDLGAGAGDHINSGEGGFVGASTTGTARSEYLKCARKWKALLEGENIRNRQQLAAKTGAQKRKLVERGVAGGVFTAADLQRFDRYCAPEVGSREVRVRVARGDGSSSVSASACGGSSCGAQSNGHPPQSREKLTKLLRSAARAKKSWRELQRSLKSEQAGFGRTDEGAVRVVSAVRHGLRNRRAAVPCQLVGYELHEDVPGGEGRSSSSSSEKWDEHVLRWRKKVTPFPAKGNDVAHYLTADKVRLTKLMGNKDEVEKKMDELRRLAVDWGVYN